MASVTLENVTKKYGNFVAVDSINLEIKDHEFVVLVGPSGCGKTTTLRMIAGLIELSSGNIYIGDRLVNDLQPKDRDIAMVFQNYALYPHMTVYENLSFSLRLKKTDKSLIDARIKEVSQILGIESFLKRKPAELSGGQQQRVALGRAIIREPQVFLMDEPLSNLDAKLRVQMRTEISRLQKRLKITTVYVTHDQTEAMTMADRIVVMKDGIVQQCDTPLSIYQRPGNKFVGGFIGSPPMNFTDGLLLEEDNRVWFVNDDMKLPVSQKHTGKLRPLVGRHVTIGIRPDMFLLNGEGVAPGIRGSFRVEIDVVEPLGAEILIYFKLKDGATQVAKIPPHYAVKPGDYLDIFVDTSTLHYFNFETEEAVI